MKVELVIQKNKELPAGAVAAIEQEFQKRLLKSYPDCRVAVRLGAQDSLSVLGAEKGAKERVENILQETWESADDWFY
ncbi:DinI-like family protein [Serratia sp. IR-2025]|uniref:DinI-like family protein n=1 Tax=Serratia TaxID=613 RepID=UPI000E3D4E2E|nr:MULTISPECIES: DinI-like family protein [Serratia]MDR8481296.1 DinI-like family protein [Serratia nevei]RFS90061.1 DNA damage-inducible protein I [Serratia marcescens]WMC78092.1 DinI-like family protein [Serratia nevei]WMC83556.1 DinI-like family protein [Serratia nevei]